MEKKVFALFVLFMLVFLAGCTQKTEKSTTGKAYVGGTQGLVLSFLSSQPPAEVFDQDNPFQIALKIENKGGFDVSKENIKLFITGINPSDFSTTADKLSKIPSDSLKGAKLDAAGNVVQGDYTTVDFDEMKYFTTVSGSVPFTIRANACYEYGTYAQGLLCIRKDLRGTTGEAGVCNPNGAITAENSGAPIQITNMKQNVAGANKIDIMFTITKTSSAADTLHKMGTSCDTAISNRDVVYMEVADTGIGKLTCSGLKGGTDTAGYVTLFNNAREVRCTQTVDKPDDFQKVLKITLKYGYKQYVDTQLKVTHTE